LFAAVYSILDTEANRYNSLVMVVGNRSVVGWGCIIRSRGPTFFTGSIIQVTPESIAFLDANRYHYDLLVRAQYLKHLDGATRQGILNVIRKEFDPSYLSDLWCSTCVATMITFAYVQYDKWLAEQGQRIKRETF
jgi:hypothetical protein